MELETWIQKNHQELIDIAFNITKNHEDTLDLYQEVIIQLLSKPETIQGLPDDNKKYYYIKVLKNNWYSNNSPYQYHRRKYEKTFLPLFTDYQHNIPDEDYTETIPDINWVYQKLEKLDWFDKDLFILWMELGSYTEVSKETTIPLNSVGKYIKKTIFYLQKEWNNQK